VSQQKFELSTTENKSRALPLCQPALFSGLHSDTSALKMEAVCWSAASRITEGIQARSARTGRQRSQEGNLQKIKGMNEC
jgi:hypothetical protein